MKTYIVEVNNNEYEVKIREKNGDQNINTGVSKVQNQTKEENIQENVTKDVAKNGSQKVEQENISGEGEEVTSPMSGKILSISANEGDSINKNEVIMTLEAMKMETEIVSPASGKISKILVAEGDKCKQGDKLALVEAGGN